MRQGLRKDDKREKIIKKKNNKREKTNLSDYNGTFNSFR